MLLVLLALFPSGAVAAPQVMGPLANPAQFNRSTLSGFINYGIDLSTWTYEVRLPAGFDPNKTYGLITFIDAGNPGGVAPAAYADVLNRHDLIWIGGVNIGNSVTTDIRMGVALLGSFRMTELYRIDPARVYAAGSSGGSRTACDLVMARTDWFRGFIGLSGASFGGQIPGWEVSGRRDNASTTDDLDNDYEVSDLFYSYSSTGYRVFPSSIRFALQTFTTDFRRTEIAGIYRYGFMNHGNATRLIVRPGGHVATIANAFEEAVRFMAHPYTAVIRDRFEDAVLGANLDAAGAPRAGAGFLNRSDSGASAVESTITYNSKTQGVLRLTPGPGNAAAIVEAKNRFSWTDASGIICDARLRAETQTGQNQSLGVHFIHGNSDRTPNDNPGFHVFLNYGAKNRAVLVKADGIAVELARWEYLGTHPMALGASDKLFWDSAVSPEFAGKSRDFRGDDVRVVLSDDGFQLTFARPVTNLETPAGTGVFAAPKANGADQEEFPISLQGRWSDLSLTTAITALRSTDWRLILSNRALDSAAGSGSALIDEIDLIAPSQTLSAAGFLAPPEVTMTSTSSAASLQWVPVPGATAYNVFRGPSAAGPFTAVATALSTTSFSETLEPDNHWYVVSATDGAVTSALSNPIQAEWAPLSQSAFELPVQSTSPFYTYNPTGSPWLFQAASGSGTAAKGSGISRNATALTNLNPVAPEGTQVAFIQGQSSISQTVTGLFPGASYRVAFLAAQRNHTSGQQTWDLRLDGTTFAAFAPVYGAPTQAYLEYTGTFIASAPSHTLAMVGTRANASTVFIDRVLVSLLPPSNAPANVTANGGGGQIRLVWNASTGATKYRIRKAAGAGSVSTVATTSALEWTDSNVTSGITYTYEIVAMNAAGESPASAQISALAFTPQEIWRLVYFGSSSNSGSAADTADADGDGFTNAQEFQAGTHPLDTTSVLRITQISRIGGQNTILLRSISGRSYKIERTTTIGLPGSWTVLAPSIPAINSTLLYTDTNPPSAGPVFYRASAVGP